MNLHYLYRISEVLPENETNPETLRLNDDLSAVNVADWLGTSALPRHTSATADPELLLQVTSTATASSARVLASRGMVCPFP